MKSTIPELLKKYIDIDNFPLNEWEERGLIPSSSEVINKLNACLKQIGQNLLDEYKIDPNFINEELVIGKLDALQLDDFDTEEKEFIIDKLLNLFDIVNQKKLLEKWLGIEIHSFVTKNYKDIKVTKQRCLRCKDNLVNWILEIDENQEYPFWEIGKCNECGKLNLMLIEKVKSFEPKTFDIVKSLRKSKYSKENALLEIEKIEKEQTNP